MINLLPSIEKKNLSIEKNKRITIVLWFLIFFFIICLILILFTIRIYIKSQVKTQESLLSSRMDEEKQEKVDNYRNEIKIINSKINKIQFYYENEVLFSDLIEKVSTTLPEEIYLEEVSMVSRVEEASKSKEERSFILVSLRGFAPIRESLLDFKNNLEQLGKDESFVNISFPPSNWLKKFNIEFSMSLEVNQ